MEGHSPGIDAQCYAYNRGDMNNQELTLFGLFLKSMRAGPRRLVLPDLVRFDQITFVHERVPLQTFFDTKPLPELAAAHDIEVLDIAPCGDEGGWDYFHIGADYIPYTALLNQLTADGLVCRFLGSLVPRVRKPQLLRRVVDEAFVRRGLGTVLQLRIEKDWLFHIEHRLIGAPRRKPKRAETPHEGCPEIAV